jgi:hypothetical protein
MEEKTMEKKKYKRTLFDVLTIIVWIVVGIEVIVIRPVTVQQQIVQIITGIKGLLWMIFLQMLAWQMDLKR